MKVINCANREDVFDSNHSTIDAITRMWAS